VRGFLEGEWALKSRVDEGVEEGVEKWIFR
jgi:hypothetical protein